MISLPAGPSRKRTRAESSQRPISPLPQRQSSRQSQRSTAPILVNEPPSHTHQSRQTRSLQSQKARHHHSPITDVQEPHENDEESDDDDEFQADDETDSETDSDDEPELTQEQLQRRSKGKAKDNSTKKPTNKKPLPDPQSLDKLTSDAARINRDNYRLISTNWTDRYIDKLLAHRKELVHTRPPSDVLAEAEVQQAQYRRTKKLLSLIGHCSYSALDAAL